MTKQEAVKLFAIFKSAYPRFETYNNAETLKPIIMLWAEMLSDIPYPVVEVAAKKLILESPYPPTISDVRKQIVDITSSPGDRIDGATAWGEVVQAIQKHGYYKPEDAITSLSPKVANVVKMIGWQEICTSTEPGVVRGQFIKMYNTYAERTKRDALLPKPMADIIRQIGEGQELKLIGGGQR